MAGKGDNRRPTAIPDDEFEWRWSLAFNAGSANGKRPGSEPGDVGSTPTPATRRGARERAARRAGQLELPLGDE